MISRRMMVFGLTVYPLRVAGRRASQDNSDEPFRQLTYPPFEALTDPQEFGYKEATEKQKAIAREIVNNTPKGPKPIDIAQTFVERFYLSQPKLISQFPAPEEWNPLIVEFLRATNPPVNNDMTPWCAAFVNWCLERAGGNGSKSASSQSFLSFPSYFPQTTEPRPGDLAIFTCHDKLTDASVGIGHVAFFKSSLPNNKIKVVGGNQSKDGHYSIISESEYTTTDRNTKRKVNGIDVHYNIRLNCYIRTA